MTSARQWTGHVVVCGLGGVGLRTVQQLHAAGVAVVVVDLDPDVRAAQSVDELGIPLIRASARTAAGLDEAGLAGARAVVCTESNELRTLEVALLVRTLRPDVRVVAHFANPGVAQALEAATGATVIDVAALSAPSFVEAALDRTTHDLDLGGTPFRVSRHLVDATGSFRSRFGDLSPLMVAAADGTMTVCPGRDHQLWPGRRGDHGRSGRARSRPASRWSGTARPAPWPSSGRWLRSDRALVLTVSALLALVVLATVVLRLTSHGPRGRLSVLDALYFSVETMATVGFGDFSFAHQGAGLELFGIAVIVIGLALVTTSFALITNLLVTRRFEQEMGSRQVPGMRGHVVVIGLGSVGLRTVELLRRAGRRVVVVDRDPANRYRGQVRALGVPVIVADATQRQTLVAAGVARSAAVAVVTSDDFANIEVALAVRNLAPVRLVLRVFDHQLEDNLEQHFGFPAVRSTADLAAPWFVGAALGLRVLRTFYVEHQPILAATFTVSTGGGPGRGDHGPAVGAPGGGPGPVGPARPTPSGDRFPGRRPGLRDRPLPRAARPAAPPDLSGRPPADRRSLRRRAPAAGTA